MTDESPDFAQFWTAYPRRIAKGEARKAWRQTASIRPPLGTLLAAIEAQKRTDQWRKDGGIFIPHPATWLRGERWDDETEINAEPVKAWHETASGITGKAQELGIDPQAYPTFPALRAAVMAAAQRGNVVALAGASRR